MKIKVIGSGSMWTSYNSASYLIDDDIIVDIPNGMCKNLFRQNINPMNINNVLITHFHGDHYFDIPFYYLLKYRGQNNIVNIYCSEEGPEKNNRLLELAFPNSVEDINNKLNINYNFNANFKVNDYDISKLLVDHGNLKPAYGYIFSKDNTKVGFTGDTTICKNVDNMAKTCDYLFCDCMFIKGTDKHMGIDMLKKLSSKYKNCKFVVSHLEDITRDELNKLCLDNVIVPEDGLEIII